MHNIHKISKNNEKFYVIRLENSLTNKKFGCIMIA